MLFLVVFSLILFALSYYFGIKERKTVVIELIALYYFADFSIIHNSFNVHRKWLALFFITYSFHVIFMFYLNFKYNWKINPQKRRNPNQLLENGPYKYIGILTLITSLFFFIFAFFNEYSWKTFIYALLFFHLSTELIDSFPL